PVLTEALEQGKMDKSLSLLRLGVSVEARVLTTEFMIARFGGRLTDTAALEVLGKLRRAQRQLSDQLEMIAGNRAEQNVTLRQRAIAARGDLDDAALYLGGFLKIAQEPVDLPSTKAAIDALTRIYQTGGSD